jgi:hypothetical protein
MDSHRCAAVCPAVSGLAFSRVVSRLRNWATSFFMNFPRARNVSHQANAERVSLRSSLPVLNEAPAGNHGGALKQVDSLKGMARLLTTAGCVCSLILGGCAANRPLEEADRARLTAIWINPNVEVSPQMYYMGPGSSVGFLFGAVGGVVTALANLSPGEQFRQFAESHGIVIDRIVREEVIRAFQVSGKPKLVDDASGSGATTLVIKVPIYGFSIPHGFSGRLVPAMSIECTLIDAQGKTIWRAYDSVTPLGNPVEGHTPEEYRANPALIEEVWRIAARKVIADMIGTL